MKREFISLLLIAAAVVTAGCGSGGGTYTPQPTKKTEIEAIGEGDGKLLMPINVGNRWTYDIETTVSNNGQVSKKEDVLTFEIIAATPKGNGTEIKLKSTLESDPSKSDSQIWLIDDRGIFQVTTSSNSGTFSPAQPTIMFPIKAGPNFNWKGQGPNIFGKNGPQTYSATMYAPQLVDTRMGQMTGVGVECNGTFTDPKVKEAKVKVISYWAKNVGLIRYRQETLIVSPEGAAAASANVLVLKNYQLKK